MNTAALVLNLALLGAKFIYPSFYTAGAEYLEIPMDYVQFRYEGPVKAKCAVSHLTQVHHWVDPGGCYGFGGATYYPGPCEYDSGALTMCGDCERRALVDGESYPQNGPGSVPRWHGYFFAGGDETSLAGPGQQWSYVYPSVIIQAGMPQGGVANIITASIVWLAPQAEIDPCDACRCETWNEGTYWAQPGGGANLIPTFLFPRPGQNSTQEFAHSVVMAAIQGMGLCDELQDWGVDKIAVEYGYTYQTLWIDLESECSDSVGQPEAEQQPEGEGEGQAGAPEYTSGNPFDNDCGSDEAFEGYLDVAWFSAGTLEHTRPGDEEQVLQFVPTKTIRSHEKIDITTSAIGVDECGISVGGAIPAGGEACSMSKDGVVLAYKYKAQKMHIPVYYGSAPCTECEPFHVLDWNMSGASYTSGYHHSIESFWIQQVKDINGAWYRVYVDGQWKRFAYPTYSQQDGVGGPLTEFNGPPGSAGVNVSFDNDGLPAGTLRHHDYSLYPEAQPDDFEPVQGFCSRANTPITLTDTEREYLASSDKDVQNVQLVDANGDAVESLDKEDMTAAVAQGTAVGIDVAGNMLASKIADAISSGFVQQDGGGLGYAAEPGYGYGAGGGSGYGGPVSFDGSQAGGGSGSDTGRGAGGEGEGYGTAAQRIAGQGGGGTGEGGTTGALVNSQGMFSQMQNDVESLVAEPVAPRWEIDVPWLDGSLHFVVDFSGDTYGFSYQVYQLVIIFRSLVLCVFVAWWAWCLMRPLFMEGW